MTYTTEPNSKGIWVRMDEEVQECGHSMATAYDLATEEASQMVQREMFSCNAQDASHVVARAVSIIPGYPDHCMIEDYGAKMLPLPLLDSKVTYPKERKLIEMCREVVESDRRVVVFVTNFRYALKRRLRAVLNREGIESWVLTSECTLDDRTDELTEKLTDGTQVIISHPSNMWDGMVARNFDEALNYDVHWSHGGGPRVTAESRLERVRYLAYRDSMQERIVEHLMRRGRMAPKVFGL